MDKDTDRDAKMVEQFKRYDISNFERISGTVVEVVPDISYWRNFNQNKINEKYVLGGLGCRNSHWRIMKTALERRYNKILILEDDVVFTKDPHQVLKDNESELDDWDMLYFGGTEEDNYRGQIVGAYAYGLNRKLIEEIYHMLLTSGMEVDNFYAKVLFHMSDNHSKSGKYIIKKMEPFNTVNIDFKCISNINKNDYTE